MIDKSNTSQPLISLIVCTYNRDKFLGDCLRSIEGQSLDENAYEVIIINNNSTDQTAEIIDSFSQKMYNNWSFHLEHQQGLSFARNRGMQASKASFLTYVDDDAILPTHFLQLQYDLLIQNPEWDGLGGKILAKFEGEKPNWFNKYTAPTFFSHYDRGDKGYLYKLGDFPFGCNMCLRKSMAIKAGGFDINLGRIGKGGLGGEEKKIFSQIISQGAQVWYRPELWVHHQTDIYRTQEPYLKKISIGLGKTHKMIFCEGQRMRASCMKATAKMWLKLAAAYLLGAWYQIQGKPEVGRHLIQFRKWVMEGFK